MKRNAFVRRLARAVGSVSVALAIAVALTAVTAAPRGEATPRPSSTSTRHNGVLTARGATSLRAAAAAAPAPPAQRSPQLIDPETEFRHDPESEEAAAQPSPLQVTADTPVIPSIPVDATAPDLASSLKGLAHVDTRFASGGNQFSNEPPDQGLCVGQGVVLEMVNSAIRVYDTSGASLTDPIALNDFWKYPPTIDRSTGRFPGPSLFDPSCLYDKATGRWFLVTDHVDQDATTGDPTGLNSIDIAVSRTADPLRTWTLYNLPGQNDGTDGTPDHHCLGAGDVGEGPCFQDYPHVGADAHGFYITTNEYPFFASTGFNGAQIYAFSKTGLAEAAADVPFVLLENLAVPERNQAGFTVWPAQAGASQFDTEHGGVEYFLSTNATNDYEIGDADGYSNEVILWSLSNTSTLETDTPKLRLKHVIVPTGSYGVPPLAVQRPGPTPFLDCLNLDCFGLGPPPSPETLKTPDTGDARMQQTWLSQGFVWGSMGTIGLVNGSPQAGITYVGVRPRLESGVLHGNLVTQGYLGTAGNTLSYPALAVNGKGHGVIAFSLLGPDLYPSAAFATFTATDPPSRIQVAAPGLGPDDGFTGTFLAGARSRWGDYGAAALGAGGSIWIASEYIGQTCTLDQYVLDTSCGGTRSALANWGTRVSRVIP